MTTLAYCIYNANEWRNFCPDCWAKIFAGEVEADAEMLDLNGDTMICNSCGKEIN
jgi:hypothetical protein